MLNKLPEDATLKQASSFVGEIKTEIDAQRSRLASILTEKGATASAEDKMSILIDKVNEIQTGGNSEPIEVTIGAIDNITYNRAKVNFSLNNLDSEREWKCFLYIYNNEGSPQFDTYRFEDYTKNIVKVDDNRFYFEIRIASMGTDIEMICCYADSVSNIKSISLNLGGGSGN